jgi:hypothetical protein
MTEPSPFCITARQLTHDVVSANAICRALSRLVFLAGSSYRDKNPFAGKSAPLQLYVENFSECNDLFSPSHGAHG